MGIETGGVGDRAAEQLALIALVAFGGLVLLRLPYPWIVLA